MAETISIVTAAGSVSGWSGVSVTRGMEHVPNSFEISMTARGEIVGGGVVAKAGDDCTVFVGSDKVITGVIDRDTNGGDANSHTLSLAGRGRCRDLVDCSAEWPGGQISGANALEIAQKLAAPYTNLTVSALPGAALGETIPVLLLNYGETAWEIIDRIARSQGLLAYEDVNGNLVMGQVGTTMAASGVIYGQNVQAWSVVNAVDQRYSDYACEGLSTATLGGLGNNGQPYYVSKDPNIAAHRLLYLVVDQSAVGYTLCEKKADWEMNRRAGRGIVASVTVDSWRDSAGALWAPNTLAPVSLPGFRPIAPGSQANAQNLLISSVTYRYGDDGGTVADLVLMPPQAFAIEPIALFPVPPGLTIAAAQSGNPGL
jgi:prophage tail gpP-like protein